MAPPHAGAHMESRFVRNIQAQSNQNVALHFSASDPSASAKSMGYVTHQGSNCRRWVRRWQIVGGLWLQSIARPRKKFRLSYHLALIKKIIPNLRMPVKRRRLRAFEFARPNLTGIVCRLRNC